MTLTQAPVEDKSRPTKRWQVAAVVIAVLALIATGTAIYYARDSNRLAHYESQARKEREAQDKIRNAAAMIKFNKPSGSIPRCTEITGQAEIVPDQVLWAAHRALRNEEYYMKRVTHTSTEWTTGRWTIGGGSDSVDKEYEIVAFYVDPEMSDFLDAIPGDPHATKLPPGHRSKVNLIVKRNSDPNSPTC